MIGCLLCFAKDWISNVMARIDVSDGHIFNKMRCIRGEETSLLEVACLNVHVRRSWPELMLVMDTFFIK